MLTATETSAATKALPYPHNVKDVAERRVLMATRRIETQKIVNQFREYLEASYGPERGADSLQLLWDAAWSSGHSNGYNEVEYFYADYAELSDADLEELDA
jgi:hypothetical protein